MGLGSDPQRLRRFFAEGGLAAQIAKEVRRQQITAELRRQWRWKTDLASRRQRALEEYTRLADQLSDAVDALVGFGVTLEQLAELSDIDVRTLERLVTRPAT